MKLDESKLILSTDWTVHFEEMLNNFSEQPTFYATINVKDLYDDWMSDCNFCPENDSFIYNVILGDNRGHTYLIETGYNFTFENMMRFFESTLKLKDICKHQEYLDSLIHELAGLIDVQDNGYPLDGEEEKRYAEIVDILHINNVEIPFGIVI